MDSQIIFIFVAVLAGVLVGSAIAWFAAQSIRKSAIETAVLKSQAELQTELSQMRERSRALEASRQEEIASSLELKAQYDKRREELDVARDEVSRLSERAGRVEALENSLTKAAEDMRIQSEELRRISADVSEKAAIANSEAQKVEALEKKHAITEQLLKQTQEELARANERRAALEEQSIRILLLEEELRQAKQAHAEDENKVTQLTAQVSQLSTQLQAEIKASQEKLALLEDAKNTLSEQFKNVANDLLEEKSKKFAEQNQTNLGQLLDPLRLQINEFKGKVEEVYVQESKDRSVVAEQVRQLVAMNQTLSQEAKNLTNALKGNVKAQGNWGELVLERVLEASGLRKGNEYIVQDNQTREDGTRAQPDVVIMLPEQRRLVVDSKVSLIAYEEYTVADSDEGRLEATRKHMDSVRKHVQGLSSKAYEKLYGNGLDFVLMFIPIEPAFMLAISNDDQLFMNAWERNVLLVSPSTLLFVVRTVSHLWRQEQQSRNAQEIAKRGAELYDKLVDFVKDLDQVGSRLKQAKESYDEAHKRLSTGKGNVIRQAEMLRDLGIKATKKLPIQLIDHARGELSVAEELEDISVEQDPVKEKLIDFDKESTLPSTN